MDDARRLLLIHRTDNDNWFLPGGAMEVGESLVDAARRETVEETGVQVEITGLVGIYTDPRHVTAGTSNPEIRQEFSVGFTARPTGGVPTPSDESRDVRRIPADQIDALTMGPLDADADRPLPNEFWEWAIRHTPGG